MNISRVTTISLVLAVAVLALAYANPLSAKGKGQDCPDGDSRPKCDDDPAASGLTFMVEMDGYTRSGSATEVPAPTNLRSVPGVCLFRPTNS